MTDAPIICAGADEAKALLKFLRHVTDLEVMHALDNRLDEMKAFKAACESRASCFARS
jgi:hypothetical protein